MDIPKGNTKKGKTF